MVNPTSLHPLVRQQLDDATGPQGTVDVERLITAVSACYEASASLANEVLETAAKDPSPQMIEGLRGDQLHLMSAVFDRLDEGIILVDHQDKVLLINDASCALLALDASMPKHKLVGASLSTCLKHVTSTGSQGPTCLTDFIEKHQTRKDGLSHCGRTSGGESICIDTHRLDENGWLLLIRSDCPSTSQQRLLKLAEQEYHSLFNNAVIGIYRSSLEGRQLRANPALVRLNGYDNESELLQSVNDIAREWYVDPTRREAFSRELDAKGRITDFVSEIYRHKTRERIWISENAWIVYDTNGKPLFYEGTVVDATERMAAEEEINHLAHHDHLTGLPNRFMLLKKLREALLTPQSASTVAVHCLDLDHFKDVNDTLGHQAGDKLLIAVGKRLRRSIKSGDILARLGGDEFTILQYGVRQPSDMDALASRIVETMNESFQIGEHSVSVGVSVGVATYNGQEPSELMRDADVALYEAKRSGRRTYAHYTEEMGHALRDRRALEDDLRFAIEQGQFELYLQPIVDGESSEPLVYEALLRWNHPTRGMVSPARFVQLAEEASLMCGLGDWVLTKTVEAAAHLPPGKRIAMNLSPLQLRADGFAEQVSETMELFGVVPDQLELEITETVIMSDDARTLEALNRLREMGLRLALDDFGTGHASLSYLQRFRFDKIKIDKSFVTRMVDDPISAAVVRAVTTLGSDMGAQVVAEGVETQDQVDALSREGCTLYQGYLFGRPAPWQTVLGIPDQTV
jgi:diguanylate cyclase (GGDEF)-like protein/PAS domain S-box-containing protein